MATDILWSATGRRWRGAGLTAEVVLRAAPPRTGEDSGWSYHRSWGHCACYAGAGILGPRWADAPYGHHEPTKVRLPHPDVTSVSVVAVDDVPFDAWRLDGSWLARTDGRGWSACHDRSVVTYAYGHEPPDGGRLAVAQLAVEIGRDAADDPDQPCQLPRRVSSVTRQGLSYDSLDSMEFLDRGLTGLYAIDSWIRAANPHGRKQAATCWSPDLPRARSTT
jgi:hypothetical protein